MSEDTSVLEKWEDLMNQWEAEHERNNYDPVPMLLEMADLIEDQLNIFLAKNPDPFDDRHPSKIDTEGDFGEILKQLGENSSLLESLSYEYVNGTSTQDLKTITALRILCLINVGVSPIISSEEDNMTINSLYSLALSEDEPANMFSLYLLGSIMDNSELMYMNRARNANLIPIVVRRMQQLTSELKAHPSRMNLRNSNLPNLIAHFRLRDLDLETKLRLCTSYLLPLAEYIDLMPYMYDAGILDLIYYYISTEISDRDVCLTFDALRLLSSLLCHRCVHLEFVEQGALQKVLQVPYPSLAATAVSVVFYYTAYFEDAMERVCLLPIEVLKQLTKYALSLIDCAHPSARCYSIYFLHIAFYYGSTYRLLEAQNVLVYLYNALCVLPIKLTEDVVPLNKDSISWHLVRAGLSAIKRYLEISLLHWMETIDPSFSSIFDEPPKAISAIGYRPIRYTPEQITKCMNMLVSRIRPDMIWKPTHNLANLGAIQLLYRIIARNFHAPGTWPWRSECARHAVDILNLLGLTYSLADQISQTAVYRFPRQESVSDAVNTLFRDWLPDDDETSDMPYMNRLDQIEPQTETDSPAAHRRRRREQVNGQAQSGRTNDHSNGLNLMRSMSVLTNGDPSNTNNTNADMSEDEEPTSMHMNGSSSTQQQQHQKTDDSEKSNGLHMLFSLSREENAGLDVHVNKAILNLVNTLVYRPIDDMEHPDHPVLANSVMANMENEQFLRKTGGLKSNEGNSVNLPMEFSPTRSARKRKHPDAVTSTSVPNGSGLISKSANIVPVTPSRCAQPITESSMPSPYGKQKTTQLLYRQVILWTSVRRNHGLMTLMHHLHAKVPISEADALRTLACRALVGLARSEEVRLILAKLPIFTKSQLHLLMKEPVLPDRMPVHSEFCRYATMLTRIVVGNLSDTALNAAGADLSLERVRKAAIVAHTKIQWDHDELLELIYRHLHAKGLEESANTLLREGQLKLSGQQPAPIFSIQQTPPVDPIKSAEDDLSTGTAATPSLAMLSMKLSFQRGKTPVSKMPQQTVSNLYMNPLVPPHHPGENGTTVTASTGGGVNDVTLNKIVESYLLSQHSQCRHPVSVCPRFSLYHPHRCPEPIEPECGNFTKRLVLSEIMGGSMRMRSHKKLQRSLIYSRFFPQNVIKDTDEEVFSTCAYSNTHEGMFIGTSSGDVKWVTFEENATPTSLHDNSEFYPIRKLEHSKDGRNLLIACEPGDWSVTVLTLYEKEDGSGWTKEFDCPMSTMNGNYAEFCHMGRQRFVVLTDEDVAQVYDLEADSSTVQIHSNTKHSGYLLNKATFSYDDNLVLNDGVIWDVRSVRGLQSPRPVHKLDKFQDLVSGRFHPNQLEIIVGSAIWDMRTWRLLNTVQSMDRLEVQFSPNSEVIYAGLYGVDDDSVLSKQQRMMQSMIRTVDSLDYSLIASVDFKHTIDALALDPNGQSMAVVERQGQPRSDLTSPLTPDPKTQIRLYMIGRKRISGDSEGEDDEEQDDEEDEEHDSTSFSLSHDDDDLSSYSEEDLVEQRASRRRNIPLSVLNARALGQNNSSSGSTGSSSSSWTTEDETSLNGEEDEEDDLPESEDYS